MVAAVFVLDGKLTPDKEAVDKGTDTTKLTADVDAA